MARYRGPRTKIARKFSDPIFGADKSFEKKNYPPGMHGNNKRRRKASEYGIQLIGLINCIPVTMILPMNSISYFVLHWLAPATFWNTIWWYDLRTFYKLSIVHVDFVCFLSTALATLCGIQLIGPNNGFGTSLNGSCTFSWSHLICVI